MRVNPVSLPSPPAPKPQVIITDHPKAVHSLRFHLFYDGAVQFLNVLILALLCLQFIVIQ